MGREWRQSLECGNVVDSSGKDFFLGVEVLELLRSKALKVRRAQVVQMGVACVQENSPLKEL